VQQAFLDFAHEKRQFVSSQRFDSLLIKFIDVADRVRILVSRAARHRFEIGVPRGRRRITDPAAAIDAVVEDVND
jgi:hypothetical protein